MKNDLILISGKQGSGKTTLQTGLAEKAKRIGYHRIYNYNFADTIYGFQDYLLNQMERFTGVPRVKKDGTLLQLLGTEWGRKTFGADVWCKIVKKRIEQNSYQDYNNLFIIGDCRFRNELDFFPQALKVRLECSEEERKTRTKAWRDNTKHDSEIDLDFCENKFNLILNTSASIPLGKDGCIELVFAELQKQTYKELSL